MANRRPTLNNDELREIHDDLVSRVADQARAWGVATPNVDAASEWCAEQMRQVEVAHEEQRTADMNRVEFDAEEVQARAAELQRSRVIKENLGEITLGPDGTVPQQKRKAIKPLDRMKAVVKWLMSMPEWRAKITTIVNTFPSGPKRDEQLSLLINQATKLYGNHEALMRAGLGKWLK